MIGAAYTSVSFITTKRTGGRTRNTLTVVFIAISAAVFITLGQAPSTLLIIAGAINGLILPIGFTMILWIAWARRDLLHGYVYPKWLAILGTLVWLLTLFLGWNSLGGIAALWS